MGAYSELGKNLMLDALGGVNPPNEITHAALFTRGTGHNVTGVTSTDLITDNAHGYANGDMLIFTAKAGGSAIVLGRPYFVINQATNSYNLALKPGGATTDLGSDLTATTTVKKLTEISGGSPAYARKAVTFAAAGLGTMDETASPVFDIPAAGVVDDVGFMSASSAGDLLALDDLTQESFAGQGTYTLSDSDFDLNAA